METSNSSDSSLGTVSVRMSDRVLGSSVGGTGGAGAGGRVDGGGKLIDSFLRRWSVPTSDMEYRGSLSCNSLPPSLSRSVYARRASNRSPRPIPGRPFLFWGIERGGMAGRLESIALGGADCPLLWGMGGLDCPCLLGCKRHVWRMSQKVEWMQSVFVCVISGLGELTLGCESRCCPWLTPVCCPWRWRHSRHMDFWKMLGTNAPQSQLSRLHRDLESVGMYHRLGTNPGVIVLHRYRTNHVIITSIFIMLSSINIAALIPGLREIFLRSQWSSFIGVRERILLGRFPAYHNPSIHLFPQWFCKSKRKLVSDTSKSRKFSTPVFIGWGTVEKASEGRRISSFSHSIVCPMLGKSSSVLWNVESLEMKKFSPIIDYDYTLAYFFAEISSQ